MSLLDSFSSHREFLLESNLHFLVCIADSDVEKTLVQSGFISRRQGCKVEIALEKQKVDPFWYISTSEKPRFFYDGKLCDNDDDKWVFRHEFSRVKDSRKLSEWNHFPEQIKPISSEWLQQALWTSPVAVVATKEAWQRKDQKSLL